MNAFQRKIWGKNETELVKQEMIKEKCYHLFLRSHMMGLHMIARVTISTGTCGNGFQFIEYYVKYLCLFVRTLGIHVTSVWTYAFNHED